MQLGQLHSEGDMGGEGIVVPNHPGARGESLAELRRRDVVRKRAGGPRTADFRSREVRPKGISASHRSEWFTRVDHGVWKLEKQKICVSPCLVSGLVFSFGFVGLVVKYHGRLRRYASVARHRQRISPSIVVAVTGFLFRPLEFTSHTA